VVLICFFFIDCFQKLNTLLHCEKNLTLLGLVQCDFVTEILNQKEMGLQIFDAGFHNDEQKN
jgi:hypothetical protein